MGRKKRNGKHPGVSVFRRKGVRTLIAVWEDPYTETRKQESLTERGFRSKAEAEPYLIEKSRWLRDERERLRLENKRPSIRATWPDILAAYLEQYRESKGERAATQRDYDLQTFRAWLSTAGRTCRVGADMNRRALISIHDFLAILKKQRPVKGERGAYEQTQEPATAATKNSRRATIIAMLNWARRREYVRVTSDDFRDCIPKFRQPKTLPTWLTSAELKSLVDAAVAFDQKRCIAGRHDKSAYKRQVRVHRGRSRFKPLTPLMLVLMLTGMRLGEALHLRWENVDFQARTLRVTSDPSTGWTVKTKHDRGITFADSPALERLLTGLRLRRGGSRYVIGGDKDGEPRSFSRPAWNRVVRAADVPSAPPKLLRSTFATALGSATNGPTPYILARRMGHRVEVAERHYVGLSHSRTGDTVEEWLEVAIEIGHALDTLGYPPTQTLPQLRKA